MNLRLPLGSPLRRLFLLHHHLLPLVLILACSLHAIASASASASPDAPPTLADILESASPRHVPGLGALVRRNPDVPVLGYVTPWNPRGKELVEQFRHKFDLVSPTWYTVHVDPDPHAPTRYQVKGGPTSPEDEAWAVRLQSPTGDAASTAAAAAPIRVTPRFLLDGWQQQHYFELLSNHTLWSQLALALVDRVEEHGYDGLVFESSATYLLQEPLTLLSDALHKANKMLVVVLPPIRTRTALGHRPPPMYESQNTMILQSLPALSKIADYITLMTYDMTGAAGRECPLVGSDLPRDSPLRQAKKGSLRQPAPNTHPGWIRENLASAIESSVGAEWSRRRAPSAASMDPSNPFPDRFLDFDGEQAQGDGETTLTWLASVANKFLMGLPMYGYTYPLFFINTQSGQGVAVAEPGGASLRSSTVLPLLRGAGRAITYVDILALLKKHRPALELDEETGESYFDYLEPASADGVGYGVRPGENVYWRAYIPTGFSQKLRTEAVRDIGTEVELGGDVVGGVPQGIGGGLALWEVGQASYDLLASI
ncbi:hypothetical protein ACQY0O_003794 [Thecaphora frezii]